MPEDSAEARAAYLRWRRNVPFTDEAIIAALRRMVDEAVLDHNRVVTGTENAAYVRARRTRLLEHFTRTRRLSRKILTICLPYLIQTCAFCDRVALYRQGNQGRCRVHRLAPDPLAVVVRRQRIESRATEIEKTRRQREDFERRARYLHHTRKPHL